MFSADDKATHSIVKKWGAGKIAKSLSALSMNRCFRCGRYTVSDNSGTSNVRVLKLGKHLVIKMTNTHADYGCSSCPGSGATVSQKSVSLLKDHSVHIYLFVVSPSFFPETDCVPYTYHEFKFVLVLSLAIRARRYRQPGELSVHEWRVGHAKGELSGPAPLPMLHCRLHSKKVSHSGCRCSIADAPLPVA